MNLRLQRVLPPRGDLAARRGQANGVEEVAAGVQHLLHERDGEVHSQLLRAQMRPWTNNLHGPYQIHGRNKAERGYSFVFSSTVRKLCTTRTGTPNYVLYNQRGFLLGVPFEHHLT